MSKQINWYYLISGLAATLLLCLPSFAQQHEGHRSFEWDKDTIELFQTLPVQAHARVKPMDSLAGLNLLKLNGKRSVKLEDGSKLNSSEWLLDTLFFPVQASDYPCFRIQADEVLIAVGLPSKKKRDWYSYNDLRPGLSKIMEEARRVADLDPEYRTVVDSQLIKLANDTISFHYLITAMDLTRVTFDVSDSEALTKIFGGSNPNVAEVLNGVPELQLVLLGQDPTSTQADVDAAQALVQRLSSALPPKGNDLTILPPAEGAEEADLWWTFNDLVHARFGGELDVTHQLEVFSAYVALYEARGSASEFHAAMTTLHTAAVDLTKSRDEYDMIPQEVKLYKVNAFQNSLVLYGLAFLLCAASWMAPGQRWIWWLAGGLTGIAFLLDTYGITMRCIIRHRPPVVTLYDTILFITTSIVLVGCFMEWITKQRIALPVAALLGCAGMFFAGKYELREVLSSGDTMASVVAVLDTNYYLAIHVTTIALGYAGGLLACGMAHVWVFAKVFGINKEKPQFYKNLTRMTYGVVCFSLLFSVFGTIMGGVWANDSWGRFWGWDPKENGALLICLWMLLILHARMGGYIREHGFMVLTIIGGVVVSISWWGVNMLDAGLHSYGRIDGAWLALLTFWGIEGVVIAISVVQRFMAGWNGPNKPKPPMAAAN
jgi:ABC-type transport system involved in cytochrome c biogenesis permease subunit